jgi:hypothetical protein
MDHKDKVHQPSENESCSLLERKMQKKSQSIVTLCHGAVSLNEACKNILQKFPKQVMQCFDLGLKTPTLAQESTGSHSPRRTRLSSCRVLVLLTWC